MSLQVIFLSALLSLFCFGNSLTITGTKDAEYDEGVDFQGVEIASTASKCYLKATLEGCKKGQKLNIALIHKKNDKKEMKEYFSTTVVESTSAACLEARCISTNGKLALSHDVEIGGDGELAKPDDLKKGDSKGLYSSSAECMRGSTDDVNIKCESTGTDINLKTGKKKTEIEEYDPETPDSVIEDADMMRAESQDSMIPDGEDGDDQLAKVWEDNDKDDEDEEDKDIDKEKEDEIAAEFEEQFAKAEEQSEVVTEDAVMAENGGMTARIQFNNWFRGCLYARCGNRQGLYHVLSGFSSHYLDRIWRFSCKQASDYNFNHCYWTGYQNSFDWPLLAQCGQNYILNGIYAYYSSGHRDRRFSLLCCRASYHYTRTCSLSGHINGYRGWMNYGVGGHQRVFTGMFSYHHNSYEDRVWKMEDCYYRR